MDDNLILDGKKYISARRASQITGYNSDYLGQLCRANKVEGKLISRTWFVSENSLTEHHKNNGRKKHGIYPLPEAVTQSVQNVGTIPIRKIGTFFDEREKILLKEVKRELFTKAIPDTKKLFNKKFVLTSAMALLICFSLAFSVIDLNNLFGKRETVVYGNLEKSLANTGIIQNIKNKIQERNEIFKGRVGRFLSFFIEKDYLAKETERENKIVTPGFSPGDDRGAVMIPLPETDASNLSKVREYLKNSFSDDVDIVPDDSGSSGVIKPVFSDSKADEYFYVMVPVK